MLILSSSVVKHINICNTQLVCFREKFLIRSLESLHQDKDEGYDDHDEGYYITLVCFGYRYMYHLYWVTIF